jgi:hypothetical protein
MAQLTAIRRASIYRQRARQLAEAATREPREIECRHLLGLAAMYQRIADEMAPASGGDNKILPDQFHDERTNSARHYRSRNAARGDLKVT